MIWTFKSYRKRFALFKEGKFVNTKISWGIVFFHKKFTMLPGTKIHWVRDQVPVDEPLCGYRGQHCIPPPSKLFEMFLCWFIFVVNTDTGQYPTFHFRRMVSRLWQIDLVLNFHQGTFLPFRLHQGNTMWSFGRNIIHHSYRGINCLQVSCVSILIVSVTAKWISLRSIWRYQISASNWILWENSLNLTLELSTRDVFAPNFGKI